MIAFWRRPFSIAPAAIPAVDQAATERDEAKERAWAMRMAEREQSIARAEAELRRNPGFAEILAGIDQEKRNG